MVREDAVAHAKGCLAAHLRNDARRLVTKHEGCLSPNVPRHHVTAADTARHCSHENIALGELGKCADFDANVIDVVENRGAHRSGVHGSITAFSPTPESRSSNAAAIRSSG